VKAVFWPHKFHFLATSKEWREPLRWIAQALQELGVECRSHPGLQAGLDLPAWKGDPADHQIAVVTHTNEFEARKFGVEARDVWVVKSTGPSRSHVTLDPLGYGPYSSITYKRPKIPRATPLDFNTFWSDAVPAWIQERDSKWGRGVLIDFLPELPDEDYVLVLAQTLGDETTGAMAWGSYEEALVGVVYAAQLVQDRPVVVKLHPWTDGKAGFTEDGQPLPPDNTRTSDRLKKRLSEWKGVHVYSGMSSVHEFLPRAHCAITCNSGAGIEALMHLVPVISWGYPEYHWAGYDLRHLCDMPRALDVDRWYDQDYAARWLWWYLRRYAVSGPESARARVRELLEVARGRHVE
jgi:hypothetical protein